MSLDILGLKGNPIQDKRHKYFAELTINFQSLRYFSKSPIYKEINFENISEEIKKLSQQIDNIKDYEIINLGTHLENSELKERQNFIFFNTKIKLVNLSPTDISKKGVIIHLIQIHSLKGIKPAKKDKLNHFFFFIKHFWDKEIIESDNALVYGKKEMITTKRIEELITLSLKMHSIDLYDIKPNIIIFPENSVPYKSLEYLKEISQKYNVIIIGGLEHCRINDNKYMNRAFIIENGNIGYQIKQTPVRIFDKRRRKELIENIECVRNPKINIFQTSIGKISIFICKDFLRLHDIIPFWASANQIDYVIVPSFTSAILSFYSKILTILNSPDCKDLKILYASMGEYGGSDIFSIKEKQRIENNYRLDQRDNVGETIVVRRTLQKSQEILPVEEFLNYIFTKQPQTINIQGIDVLTTATGAEILDNVEKHLQNEGFLFGMLREEDFEEEKEKETK